MNSLNPMFQKKNHINNRPALKNDTEKIKKNRQPRNDKCHNIKFPVNTLMQMKLRTYCKQARYLGFLKNGQPMSQTVFNTALLLYGLKQIERVSWDLEYEDTKIYMHTMPKEEDYRLIGGPYGIAIQKQTSDRRVVFMVVHSVLQWIEKGGSLEEILQ
ncbi:hypothetical protein ACFVHQ_19710 [Actinomycetes bacterium NPDC127524]